MSKITISFLFLFFGAINGLIAQDPVYSQFTAAPLHLNPAFAGLTPATKIGFIYRYEWPLWPDAYRSFSVNFEQPFPELNSGIGLSLTSDESGGGLFKMQQGLLVYSYEVNLNNESRIRLGLEAGFIQHGIQWSKLIFGNQIDPLTGPFASGVQDLPDQTAKTAMDLGAGILFSSPKFYAGLSIKHLNRPELSFLPFNPLLREGWPARYTFQAGTQISLPSNNISKGRAFLSPNVMLIRQGSFTTVNGGTFWGLGNIFSGIWYRHTIQNPDAVVFLTGYKVGALSIGYSFDLVVSGLNRARTAGSHEIGIIFNFADADGFQKKKAASDLNNCLKLFSF
jgi:type IX secretion system PorP/SprF family membrane protein